MNTRVRNKLREHLEDPPAIAEHGLKDIQDIVGRETRVREQLARRGYRPDEPRSAGRVLAYVRKTGNARCA
jgi:hypothetical protein